MSKNVPLPAVLSPGSGAGEGGTRLLESFYRT